MTTKTLSRLVGLLLIVHGLIHLLGPIEIWGLADIEELTGEATIAIGEASLSGSRSERSMRSGTRLPLQ